MGQDPRAAASRGLQVQCGNHGQRAVSRDSALHELHRQQCFTKSRRILSTSCDPDRQRLCQQQCQRKDALTAARPARAARAVKVSGFGPGQPTSLAEVKEKLQHHQMPESPLRGVRLRDVRDTWLLGFVDPGLLLLELIETLNPTSPCKLERTRHPWKSPSPLHPRPAETRYGMLHRTCLNQILEKLF